MRLLRYLALSSDLALKFMALSFFDPNIKEHILTLIQYNSSSIEVSMYPINDKNFQTKSALAVYLSPTPDWRTSIKVAFHMMQ